MNFVSIGVIVVISYFLPLSSAATTNRPNTKLNLSIVTSCKSASSITEIETVLPPIRVASSSINVFSTPTAWFKGDLYTINVEPPEGINTKLNLRTVVRKGIQNSNGNWVWSSKLVEGRTLEDRYHTQASIAVDRSGYIHVAYNMHNMPWQYAVSKKAEDISEFEFKGKPITDDELYIVKIQNRTPFPDIGQTAIPGTQITYPAFFYDRNRDVYVTYRFAIRPKRSWNERGFAGGIAKYDIITKKWLPIGGAMQITSADADLPSGRNEFTVTPFAFQKDWSVYLIRLFFDKNNRMHLSWTWRTGGAGPNCTHPSYAFSSYPYTDFFGTDGSCYQLPIRVECVENVAKFFDNKEYYAPTSLAVDRSGQPWIVLNPIGGHRCLVHYDSLKNGWSDPEAMPFGATEIYIDKRGTQWAFSSGICIFQRNLQTYWKWEKVYCEKGYGYPKILPVPQDESLFIHTQSSDGKRVKILKVKLNG